jgi:hypothetical protein
MGSDARALHDACTLRAVHAAPIPLVVIVAALSACASNPPQTEEGLYLRAKANKHYLIGERTLSFTELETQLKETPPPRIVVEYSRQPAGTACVFLLGTQLGIPVWTRSANGRMHYAHFNGDTPEIDTAKCR